MSHGARHQPSLADRPGRGFFVGGHYIDDGNGEHVMVGQMHVRHVGAVGAPKRPVVCLPGGAQTGAHWEQTPDGRPGFADLLAADGRPVYTVDLPGVGRSRYHHALHGPLSHYTAEVAERIFSATAVHGGWPGAELHTQWPGTGRMGDPAFDAFYATQVGYYTVFDVIEPAVRAAMSALLDLTGPCHLLTHSQAGPFGWHVPDERPGMVGSIVALEPKGPPYFDMGADTSAPPPRPFGLTTTPLTYDPPLDPSADGLPFADDTASEFGVQQVEPPRRLLHLADVPVLVVTAEASYHTTYDHRTVQFLRTAGVPVEQAILAEHGIRGNGHLMALESNNDQIAALVAAWFDARDVS